MGNEWLMNSALLLLHLLAEEDAAQDEQPDGDADEHAGADEDVDRGGHRGRVTLKDEGHVQPDPDAILHPHRGLRGPLAGASST